VLLGAASGVTPAAALDAHYEGQREFVRGHSSCSTQSSPVNFDVGSDGGLRGDVVTTEGVLRFYGTVSATGKLIANYRASAAAEFASIEGAFSDDRFAGFTQSKTCRYRLDLTRQ
jgi:hypothetical protein